ncbi:MAG TPA: NERD domain-containing protein [Pirellulales bacterium]|jgi:hypothetical protein|nr:NERD domain-containing protein [Pirellulales bacterium]
MARMIPERLASDVKSSGEKQVFALLESDPDTADWIVLHSLGLARHVKRLYGEIDFVVLIPEQGVFCLEVKGGAVARRNGEWVFTNRYNESTRSPRSPFAQVKDAMFSLKAELARVTGRGHPLNRIVFGYGVLFPHVVFGEQDPEWENWQIYDRDSRRLPINRFLRELARHCHIKVSREPWYDSVASRPTAEQISELLAIFRGDFELVASSRDIEGGTDVELLRLTTEQYEKLDVMEDNPRCLFEGGGGTGKTFLAREFARRIANDNRSVLLLCFNRLLGKWLDDQNRAEKLESQIVAGSFHSFLDALIKSSSHWEEFRKLRDQKPADIFDYQYPFFSQLAMEEGVRDPFDVLIIDEAQDLIRPAFLDALDVLVRGGLAGGRWTIFCDFERQAIYGQLDSDEMFQLLQSRAPHFARARLRVNCRNTRAIGEETCLLSGFEKPPFRLADVPGRAVDYRFVPDNPVQARAVVEQVVSAAINEGVGPREITLLSPVVLGHSCLAGMDRLAGQPLVDLADQAIGKRNRTAIGHSTIHAFKGMENSMIVLHDVSRIADDESRSLLYVGMSRARERLVVIMKESCRTDYQQAVRDKIQRSLGR